MMARRDDFLEAYWIEPLFGLHGEPRGEPKKRAPRRPRGETSKPAMLPPAERQDDPSLALLREAGARIAESVGSLAGPVVEELPEGPALKRALRKAGVRVRQSGSRTDGYYARELGDDPEGHPTAGRIILRSRTGFRYERIVELHDFVTLGEAAKMLGVPFMTVYRWVDSKRLKSKKLNGHTVVRLRDVLAVAKERGKTVKMMWRIEVAG